MSNFSDKATLGIASVSMYVNNLEKSWNIHKVYQMYYVRTTVS